MLISLPKAMSPLVVIPLLSVTHGQWDARLTVTFPAYAGTKFILPSEYNLPRAMHSIAERPGLELANY